MPPSILVFIQKEISNVARLEMVYISLSDYYEFLFFFYVIS